MENNTIKHKGTVALEEYVIKGNRISILEGVLLFGVSNPYEADGTKAIFFELTFTKLANSVRADSEFSKKSLKGINSPKGTRCILSY